MSHLLHVAGLDNPGQVTSKNGAKHNQLKLLVSLYMVTAGGKSNFPTKPLGKRPAMGI